MIFQQILLVSIYIFAPRRLWLRSRLLLMLVTCSAEQTNLKSAF